ncbi:MAG: DUF11 domain-containing protein [Verrucomicrobia bacterium]|jgi:uncharacterized repeat protein (TIGR01451 family)|nr:DUF11 domain-containing protein [Verrucomicrobiota bacterium]
MKVKLFKLGAAASALAVLLLSGCATQTATTDSASEPEPASEPAPTRTSEFSDSGYGPAYTTFERDGILYVKGSTAYPTGILSSSSLLLEKVVPQEVMVGAPYRVEYTLRNLTDVTLGDVVLEDVVGGNFNLSDSAPAADAMDGNTATWLLGDMPPGATRNVILRASSPEEGFAEICSRVTFVPVHCEQIRVVRADLELVLDLMPQGILCDPIPSTITVRNTGSSRLTDVTISESLPSGLTTLDGLSTISIPVGTLDPGQSESFDVDLKAARTGSFEVSPEATSAQGVRAQDMDTTMLAAPELVISCDSPAERFIGRPVNVCLQVENSGDAPSNMTVVSMAVPAGASFQGATGGGTLVGNEVVWNVGSLAPGGNLELCATFTGSIPSMLTFTSTAEGDCADPVSSTCRTELTGIPAILLEVIDLEDPIEVGANQTYQIVVTNQGTAPATNVQVVATLEDEQRYVSSSGSSSASASGQRITMRPVAAIAPGDKAVWEVVVEALAAGDIRFSVEIESDQIQRPVRETEATNQY